MKKWLKIGAIALGVIFAILIGLWITMLVLVDEDLIVSQLEASINSRVEVRELNVGLFSAVSSIGLEGVKIGRRDDEANRGVPQSERQNETQAVISAEEVELSVSLGALLDKRLEVQSFVISEPEVDLTIYPSGDTNLTPLFLTPEIVNGEPNPALNAPEEPEEEEEVAEARTADEPFTAKSLPIAGKLDRIGIENGTLNLDLRSSGEFIKLTNLDLFITDIDIDPENLADHNSADVEIDVVASIANRSRKEVALLNLVSDGTIQPFETESGEFNTFITYQLTLLKGSKLHSFLILQKLQDAFPLLSKANARMENLSGEAEVIRDVEILISYGNGLITILNDPTIPTVHYDFAVQKDSWIRLTNGTHKIKGRVIASEQESAHTLAQIDKFLQESSKGSEEAAEAMRNRLLPNMVEADRIFLTFNSTGLMNDPKVALLNNLPDLADLLREAASGLVQDRIQNELDRVPGGNEVRDQLNRLF